MLVNAKKMLDSARKNKYAIPHFNINNLEWVKYILEECNKLKTPVILGVSEGAIKYMGGYNVVSFMVRSMVVDLNIDIPVCLHLDHGSSFESCKKAIDAGFTSVMIDASKYEIDKNIEITKKVVNYAKKNNVTVEAEIGHIGGTEDDIKNKIGFATIEEAKKLVEETNIDFLAPALGSVHGLYKGKPNLDFNRMKEISELVKLPLVLHGGTGLENEDLKKAIEAGTCKVNINTELQIAWSTSVRKYLDKNKEVYDPRKIISSGEEAIKNSIRNIINVLHK